jgi:hypothetical protein
VLNGIIGDDATGIDAVIKDVSDVADAALPKSGGVMTGRVDLFSATSKLTALGSISGANAINLALSDVFTATISGATTFSISNVPSGTWMTGFILFLTNGGSNVTWPTSVDWPGGEEPVLQSSGVDILGFMTVDSGTTWHGVLISGDSSSP